jgi:hypothetical protein
VAVLLVVRLDRVENRPVALLAPALVEEDRVVAGAQLRPRSMKNCSTFFSE